MGNMRKKLIAGNWKMNQTPSQAIILAGNLKKLVTGKEAAEILICPPYTALIPVRDVLKGSSIHLGAQDLHWEDQGAYTGKISADMLLDAGCTHVIIGHSEQRTYFHETDATVNRKLMKALASGLIPIVCIGETLEERDSGRAFEVVKKQIEGGFAGLQDVGHTIIAYEPVWAIGTGRNATPAQAQEMHDFIRKAIASLFSPAAADRMRILYGGSMKPDNAAGLLAQPDIDGGLIGGASLNADSFYGIIQAAG
jgi:triosephosphate isomerase